MSISKFNKTTVKFDVDTSNFKFCKLKELDPAKTYKLLGMYINTKSKFGEVPVFIIDGWLVDGTASMVETVKLILADTETVADIKAGNCGIKVRTYENNFGKQYSVEYVDI